MEVILTFDLSTVEDQDNLELALKASNLYAEIWDLREHIRMKMKHGDYAAESLLEEVYEDLNDIIEKVGVK